jgi:hypothetical protein
LAASALADSLATVCISGKSVRAGGLGAVGWHLPEIRVTLDSEHNHLDSNCARSPSGSIADAWQAKSRQT